MFEEIAASFYVETLLNVHTVDQAKVSITGSQILLPTRGNIMAHFIPLKGALLHGEIGIFWSKLSLKYTLQPSFPHT